MAMEGIPADFIGMAVRRFIQGQVERANLQWRPTPPELAVEARRLWDQAREHERLLAARLPAPPSNDPPEPTPEERQRCAEMWDRVRPKILAAAESSRMPLKPRRFRGAAEPPPPPPEKDLSDYPRAGATRAEIDAWQARQEEHAA